ncbi:MAG: nitrogen regulation protein NR(II) [Planctomycetota bacterium]
MGGTRFLRWRPWVLGGILVGVSLGHYLTPIDAAAGHQGHVYHALFRWSYHLPIILAAFWYGLRGGVLTALAVTLLYVPHVLVQWHGGMPEQWFEILLYNVVGLVTGVLAQKIKTERDRYRLTAEERDRAYRELQGKTRVLLETENELRHADRLATLGQLSAVMAHEIKTPLASIRGAAEIVVGERTDAAEREEFSAILVRESDRLNRVVARFLDFARPRASVLAEANVGDAIRDVVELVQTEASKRHVRLHAHADIRLPPVRIDPGQLRQVLLNLVMNALQAMGDGGGRLVVGAEQLEASVRIVVRDSGPGIPSSVRERIFEPFVTTRSDGTGLGLAIVKRILDNHASSIEIRGADGGGVIVEILLPAGA